MDPRASVANDVAFLVGSKKRIIKGNKAFLAFTSTVFHRMFFSDFPSKNEIEIPDVDADAFQVMINSLSGKAVNLNADNVAQIFYLAEKYDLQFLRQVCKTFIVNSIDSSNALALLNTFQHYNESDINEKCLSIILDDPLVFFNKPEYPKAPADVVRRIFKSHCINCSTQDVKIALLDWMKKNGKLENNEVTKWVEEVENQLQITREELEMKMLRQSLFRQTSYTTVENKYTFKNTFILEGKMGFFLHGFGLILGKVERETFTVTITTGNCGSQSLGSFTVEKKGPIDIVSIQDVLFKKISIFHNTVKVTVTIANNPFPTPCFQGNDEKRNLTYLILSKMP
jgi:BTB/POZ domain